MQETSNYKLNKWDASDRIMMKDFNDDNQAIEEALTAHDEALAKKAEAEDVAAAQKWIKIGEKTLDSAGSTLALSVSNLDNYYKLAMEVYFVGPPAAHLIWNETNILYPVSGTDAATKCVCRFDLYSANHGGIWISYMVHKETRSKNDLTINGEYEDSVSFAGDATVGMQAYNGEFSSGAHLIIYALKK